MKPRVAFLCTHNSCRSQMAEALGRLLAGDVFESCSAGTHPSGRINPDAVRLMKARWGVDLEKTQRSKGLEEVGQPDVVILMGCGVECPRLPAALVEDWGLEDPTGRGDEAFLQVMDQIEARVLRLRRRLEGWEPGQ